MLQSKLFEVSHFYFLRNESLDHRVVQRVSLWPLAVYVAEGLGICGIIHGEYVSTRASLASLGLVTDG